MNLNENYISYDRKKYFQPDICLLQIKSICDLKLNKIE